MGSGPVNPNLAGQDATYMLNALGAYRAGTRDDDVMTPKVKNATDEELRALAVYYAALDPKPLGLMKPLGPEAWAEKCDRCQGPGKQRPAGGPRARGAAAGRCFPEARDSGRISPPTPPDRAAS